MGFSLIILKVEYQPVMSTGTPKDYEKLVNNYILPFNTRRQVKYLQLQEYDLLSRLGRLRFKHKFLAREPVRYQQWTSKICLVNRFTW